MGEFTHKGWFLICPIYIGDIDSDAPLVAERHWLLKPLFWFSEWSYRAYFFLMLEIDEDYEPKWPLHVSGEL